MATDRIGIGWIVGGVVALLVPQTAYAQQPFACSIASRSAAAVLHEGAQKQAPLGLDNCDGVQVTSGEVIVTYLGASGRRKSATLRAGKTITSASLLGAEAPREGGLWLSVLDVLKSPAQNQTLGTRGQSRLAVPEGECLALQSALRFDFGTTSVAAFELREGGTAGRVVLRVQEPGSVILVETRRLVRGREYAWSAARAEGAALQGRFRLAVAGELAKARRALGEIDADAGLDPGGRALVKAEWLRQQRFEYDAVEFLRREGFEVSP